MRTGTKVLLGGVGGLVALWVAWGVYVDRSTERVPYTVLDSADGVELRRYPRTVLVETTADDDRTAFRRLFRYISGRNEGGREVAMTTPVASGGERAQPTAPGEAAGDDGEDVSMTAPVRTDRDGTGVTMAFYLPADYGPDTAPKPVDSDVRLVVEPPKTTAVRRFSWFATTGRVARQRRRLLDELSRRGIETIGSPVLLQYDDPWTPPFMRRNEVEVPLGHVDGTT